MASKILFQQLNVMITKLFFKHRYSILSIIFLTLCFIVSLIIYIMRTDLMVTHLLYFPVGDELMAELHHIPKNNDREALVKDFIEELILGPIDIDYDLLFPRETELRTVMMRKNTLYIDFDASLFTLHDVLGASLKRTFEIFVHNIQRNFPFVHRVIVMIDGEEIASFQKILEGAT